MNGFDLTYCTNKECKRTDCRRHYNKKPEVGFVSLMKCKEKNCKYYIGGYHVCDTN